MTDLLLKILRIFPTYLSSLGGVISSPKGFVAKRNSQPAKHFAESLAFFGISLVLMVVLNMFIDQASLSFWNDLLKEAMQHGISTLLLVTFLTVAWRLVGGKASFKSMFITYAYFTGVAFVIVNSAMLVLIGAHESLFPQTSGGAIGASSYYFLIVGLTVITLSIFIWLIVCWGAFRQLNGKGKFRSIIALLVFLSLAGLAIVVNQYVGVALHPPGAKPEPAVSQVIR